MALSGRLRRALEDSAAKGQQAQPLQHNPIAIELSASPGAVVGSALPRGLLWRKAAMKLVIITLINPQSSADRACSRTVHASRDAGRWRGRAEPGIHASDEK